MDDDKSKIVILIVDSPVKFALFDFFALRPKNVLLTYAARPRRRPRR
jgi:hypothetical protein